MRRSPTPETDPAPGVAPTPRPGSPWRVVSAQPLEGYRLQVTFTDGVRGEVDLRGFLQSQTVSGTLFEALRDRAEFARVRVELGAVAWPNGADLAPDAMYDAVRVSGRWVVGE